MFAPSCISSGTVPETILPLLSASCLIALRKLNQDFQPIAIGEVGSCKTHLLAETGRLCYLFQHGVGTENEAVLMTHHTQVLLESHACNLTGRYWRQTSEMALISFPGLIFWIKFTVFIQIYRIVSSRHRRTLKLVFTIVEISRHSFNLRMEFTNLAFRWFRLYAIFSEECLDGVQTKSKHSGCV